MLSKWASSFLKYEKPNSIQYTFGKGVKSDFERYKEMKKIDFGSV